LITSCLPTTHAKLTWCSKNPVSAWHTHPLGQALIVSAGCGWVQREGHAAAEREKGEFDSFHSLDSAFPLQQELQAGALCWFRRQAPGPNGLLKGLKVTFRLISVGF
jgi:hypothetical protein